MFFSALPPPTENTRTTSSGRILLPRNQLEYTVPQQDTPGRRCPRVLSRRRQCGEEHIGQYRRSAQAREVGRRSGDWNRRRDGGYTRQVADACVVVPTRQL